MGICLSGEAKGDRLRGSSRRNSGTAYDLCCSYKFSFHLIVFCLRVDIFIK